MKIGQQQLSFLCVLLFSAVLGIVAAERFAEGAPSFVFGGLLLAGIVLLLWSARLVLAGSARIWGAAALLFFVLGMVRALMVLPIPADDISRWDGKMAYVSGVLREAPQITPTPEGVRVRYLIGVRRADSEDATGGIYIYATEKSEKEVTAQIGDMISAQGRVLKIRGYKNPGMIDIEQLMRARGVTARLHAGKAGVDVKPAAGGFLRSVEDVRAHYRAKMREAMPEADAAAVFAMVFGGYEGIRPELVDAFTTTGLVHILSVSGSHITLLAGLVAWLASAFSLRRGFAAVLVAFAVFGYSALSGFVAPAVRAAIMGGLSFFALATGREYDGRRILVVTALAMLFVSPLLLYDVSFQLSFASTAGLLCLSPRFREWALFTPLPRPLRDGLALTLGAQLATIPICAWYFHAVSLSAFIANLVVVPILELLMVAALFAGLLALILPFLARVVFAMDSLLLGLSYELTRMLAALPMSRVYLPPINIGTAAIYYALLFYCMQTEEVRHAVYLRLRALPWRWIFPACGALLLAFAVRNAMRPAELAVHFIDVGQGDAALVVTPHGRAFMIDAGGVRDAVFDLGGRVDVPYLLQYGVTELDAAFLTHAHEDHAAGLAGILRRLPVGRVLTAAEGQPAYQASLGLSAAELAATPFIAVEEGTRLTLDGVTVDVLFAPDASKHGRSGNEISNVYRVSYGKASFLFTGDLEKEQEAKLLEKTSGALQSTVLKVGHHGSKTSTSAPFLSAVAPRWAVIDVGAGNRFGHPSQETLDALSAANVKTYRTDRDGAIVFRTDGNSMRVETYIKRK
ncbi:MAG: DNA internalization-related competence protein ComEC/Rec2 [Schwartzia sp.]|nr:DNA internalization-related competence protein ComEC/Rec2 [Schwartzia sp. (in: firmicutes)]